MRKRTRFLSVTILMILIGTTACRPDKVELPFETIDRSPAGPTSGLWSADEPGLMIISAPGDLPGTDKDFTQDAHTQLQNLDFEQHFAVFVFQGRYPELPPPPFGIEVQRIVREGDAITIYTDTHEPVDDEVVRRAVQILPYHLVKILRVTEVQGEKEFTLVMDGTVVHRQTYVLPRIH